MGGSLPAILCEVSGQRIRALCDPFRDLCLGVSTAWQAENRAERTPGVQRTVRRGIVGGADRQAGERGSV